MSSGKPVDHRMPISVLIADDQPDMRMLIEATLRHSGGFNIVAEAKDGQEAIDLTRTHHPDVVIMDISMPKLNGLEALGHIRSEFPNLPVLMFSALDDPEIKRTASRLGAYAYVPKHECSTLPQSLRNAMATEEKRRNHTF